MVDNAFEIIKHTSRELLNMLDLDVVFLHDVTLYYTLMQNMLLGQSHEDVAFLLSVMNQEGPLLTDDKEEFQGPKMMDPNGNVNHAQSESEKVHDLRIHLGTTQHIIVINIVLKPVMKCNIFI